MKYNDAYQCGTLWYWRMVAKGEAAHRVSYLGCDHTVPYHGRLGADVEVDAIERPI